MKQENTIKRAKQRALMVSRFAYDAHFQRMHDAERAEIEREFAEFEAELESVVSKYRKQPIETIKLDRVWLFLTKGNK